MFDEATMTFHVCNIRHANGDQLRIVAYRCRCDPVYADYEVRAIGQRKGKPAYLIGDATFDKFPRALGVHELFARVLQSGVQPDTVYDDAGNVVPMPEPTVDEMRDAARRYYSLAMECGKQVLKMTEKTS